MWEYKHQFGYFLDWNKFLTNISEFCVRSLLDWFFLIYISLFLFSYFSSTWESDAVLLLIVFKLWHCFFCSPPNQFSQLLYGKHRIQYFWAISSLGITLFMQKYYFTVLCLWYLFGSICLLLASPHFSFPLTFHFAHFCQNVMSRLANCCWPSLKFIGRQCKPPGHQKNILLFPTGCPVILNEQLVSQAKFLRSFPEKFLYKH